MSQAASTHTRNSSGVTLSCVVHVRQAHVQHMHQDHQLRSACERAIVANRAMTTLALSVAELAPADPRHAAAHAAVDLLRPEWRRGVECACALTPATRSGLVAKSTLLAAMVERDETDAVVGGPVAELAASLADDLLSGTDPDFDHRL